MKISNHKLQGTKTAYCYILQTVQDWKTPVQSMVRCVCSGSIAWSCSTADTRRDADQPRLITAATAAFYGRWPQEIDGRNINDTSILTLCSGRLHSPLPLCMGKYDQLINVFFHFWIQMQKCFLQFSQLSLCLPTMEDVNRKCWLIHNA